MSKYKLSQKELEIMKVLWRSERPLAAQDIPIIQPNLNKNTVLAVTRGLLKKSYIKVSDIVYHNKVLTRIYEPTITCEEYWADSISDSSVNISVLVSTLIRDQTDDDELVKILDLAKQMLKK